MRQSDSTLSALYHPARRQSLGPCHKLLLNRHHSTRVMDAIFVIVRLHTASSEQFIPCFKMEAVGGLMDLMAASTAMLSSAIVIGSVSLLIRPFEANLSTFREPCAQRHRVRVFERHVSKHAASIASNIRWLA